MKHLRKKWSLVALVFAIVFSFVGSTPTTAAGQQLIKVALFIDNGNAYRNTVPTVTLSSQTGLSIGIQGIKVSDISNDVSSRFSVDQYYVVANETENLTSAQQVAQQLSQAGFKSEIIVTELRGAKYYIVRTGSFATLTEASNEASKLKTTLNVNAKVKGPLHISTGIYATKAEAISAAKTLRDAGFISDIVLKPETAGVKYEVIVGDEASVDAINGLKTALKQAFPSLPQADFDATKPYLVWKEDVFIGGTNNALSHFYFGNGQTVSIAPVGQSYIKVDERSAREYRGTFELVNHKGKMAVLNVVDVEQYLYSVVGTEMSTGWPLESLKAQAVIARSYLWAQGMKYGIANVSDTVSDQAYYGVSREAADVMKAVNDTTGQVVKFNGSIIGPTYYSNAGGMTADGSEVWGGTTPYYTPTTSPDEVAERGKLNWYAIVTKTGQFGYVRSDYVSKTGQTHPLGFAYGVIANTDTLNLRSAPTTDYEKIGSLVKGEQIIIVDTIIENSAFRYLSRPFTGAELAQSIKLVDVGFVDPVVKTLKIDATGPSGRVIKMSANGKNINVPNPDKFRGALGGIRSTLFQVEQVGALPVIGAGGKRTNLSESSVVVLGANGQKKTLTNTESYLVMDNQKKIKNASVVAAFRFHNKGFGHGLGLSQWGAKALAEQGYDYARILKHYYTDKIVIEQR